MGKEISMKHMRLDYFLCGICKMTVSNPMECCICENLFCYTCLLEYFNNKEDSPCPFGCMQTSYERVGHAFEKLMSFIYAKCRHRGCPYEDCIKYLQKHEQICKHRSEEMQLENPEEMLAQRDMFWISVLNRFVNPIQSLPFSACNTPNQPMFVSPPLNSNDFPQIPVSQTPRTQSKFKF